MLKGDSLLFKRRESKISVSTDDVHQININILSKAIEIRPKTSLYLFAQAGSYHKSGKEKAALAMYLRLLKEKETHPIDIWLRNLSLLEMTKFDLAPYFIGNIPSLGAVYNLGSNGLWRAFPREKTNLKEWMIINHNTAESVMPINFKGNGTKDGLVAAFGELGIWIYRKSRKELTWIKISNHNPEQLLAFHHQNSGEKIIGNFGSLGIWIWDNAEEIAYSWKRITSDSPSSIKVIKNQGKEEIRFDFAAKGTWSWEYETRTWKKIG